MGYGKMLPFYEASQCRWQIGNPYSCSLLTPSILDAQASTYRLLANQPRHLASANEHPTHRDGLVFAVGRSSQYRQISEFERGSLAATWTQPSLLMQEEPGAAASAPIVVQ